MPEYIERDKVLSKEEFFGEHATWDNPMTDGCMAVRSDFIINFPAADVVPVRHGRWRDTGSGQECSICKEIQYGHDTGRHYCPNCGADMQEKKEK